MNDANKIVDALLGEADFRYHDFAPPKWDYGDVDKEIEIAARDPFRAMMKAKELGKHVPKLWARIKGSPYEREYRQLFNPVS